MLASKNAVATHENEVPRLRASDMVGSAVLVTLPSSAESRSGTQMAIKERQKPSSRRHFRLGVSEGKEGNVGRLRPCGASCVVGREVPVFPVSRSSQRDVEDTDIVELEKCTVGATEGRSNFIMSERSGPPCALSKAGAGVFILNWCVAHFKSCGRGIVTAAAYTYITGKFDNELWSRWKGVVPVPTSRAIRWIS